MATVYVVCSSHGNSVCCVQAALEAMNELDLFGARGGPSSVIHVMPDEAQQCQVPPYSLLLLVSGTSLQFIVTCVWYRLQFIITCVRYQLTVYY